jgi:pre-mRNA-splicing factor SPF27
VSNWNSEAELKAIETELKAVVADTEALQAERNARQEGTAAELKVLEESWRKGISGLVEVQVATEGLRQQVLDARRAGVN